MPAPDAAVFWQVDADTASIWLTAAPAALDIAPGTPRLTTETSRVTDEQGLHLLETLQTGERLHIIRTANVVENEALAALIPLDGTGFGRVEAVLRLLASLYGRTVPSDTRITRQQRLRAKRMLRALDGRRAGASQKLIASAIFRLAPMDRNEWQTAPARFATRSLIRDALAMVAGGYRKLLRHQHRP